MHSDARSSNPKVIVRLPALLRMTGVSRSTAHRYQKNDPLFPKSIKLGRSDAKNAAVGYVLEDIQRWIEGKVEKSSESAGE